jgi:2-polyprenyl-3-methyl-5-hydroxy-6-metoxy-1,4-benzoquinol methylase
MTSSELNYFGPPYAERFKKGHELDRDVDRTQLRHSHLMHQPHKDYLGHCFRWGFVSRFVNPKARILDAGCGQDMPLMWNCGGSNKSTVPECYVGVDVNPLPEPKQKWAHSYGKTNVVDAADELMLMFGNFNLIASLEVYEHIAPQHALAYLNTLAALLDPDGGRLILSTPVYSHQFKQPKNHVNERTKAEIEDDLHRAGFIILGQYGTFGNYNQLKKMLSPEERASYERQREFYGDDVLGCYLAPRFPEASRNVTHVCAPAGLGELEECELKESVV